MTPPGDEHLQVVALLLRHGPVYLLPVVVLAIGGLHRLHADRVDDHLHHLPVALMVVELALVEDVEEPILDGDVYAVIGHMAIDGVIQSGSHRPGNGR